VNVRVNATIRSMAISGLLLTGCASDPTMSSRSPLPANAPMPVDTSNLPQITLSGATRAEAKSLAMGAARSKGWTISNSTKDRMTAQRPADAESLAANAPDAGIPPGSTLEVTSLFSESGGGVNVATKAEIVTPAMGGRPPARSDYTDALRDTLTQSLDSLRESWSRNRGRLARAAPPAEGWKNAWEGAPPASTTVTTTAAVASQAPEPVVRPAPAPTLAQTTAPVPQARPTPTVAASARPTPAIREAAAPERPVRASPATTAAAKPASSRPAPEPRKRPAGAAPVVDASSVANTRGQASTPAKSTAKPTAKATTPVSQRENMIALPTKQQQTAGTRTTGSVSLASNAERYARQHGCKVSSKGSQLIESRKDGEVHKVPCQGSDSFLVKCQNGTCKGLL
jgi:hypothetical protein